MCLLRTRRDESQKISDGFFKKILGYREKRLKPINSDARDLSTPNARNRTEAYREQTIPAVLELHRTFL